MAENYDVAIIGGGIIGSSIAAHLAEEKLNTILINCSTLGLPASAAAAGLLTPFQLDEVENPTLKDLCFKSHNYFFEFCKKIISHSKVDIGLNKSGTLFLLFSNYEFAKKEMENKELKSIDPNITFLNKNEVVKIEKNITKEIIGAYHYPQEGYVNNPKLLKAINQYLIDKNVFCLDAYVQEFIVNKNKIETIILSNNERIKANTYVLCNGSWANKFLKEYAGIKDNLIKPIKGEILQFGGFAELPINKSIFCNEGYAVPRPMTNSFEMPTLLIGSTKEETDIENKYAFYNSLNGISTLTKLFHKLFPELNNISLINHWAGLRPKTSDGMPIIGLSNIINNLYLSIGHYRNGILMGPYTGNLIKEMILGNKTETDIKLFNVERFFEKNKLSSVR